MPAQSAAPGAVITIDHVLKRSAAASSIKNIEMSGADHRSLLTNSQVPLEPVATAQPSSVKLRVTDGSTGIPGPVVVETVTFFRYRPFDDDGLARSTSSRAAP